MITVLCANIETLWANSNAEAALQSLPEGMRQAIARYQIDNDRLLRLTGKILLQQLLIQHGQRYTLADVQRTEHNRPYIPNSRLDFSIAHSGRVAVCALSTEGNVGIDIEQVRPTGWQHFELFFEAPDWTFAMSRRHRQFALFELWTQREACIKALDEYPFTEEPFSFKGWHRAPLDEVAGNYEYAGTIATRCPAKYSVEWLVALPEQTIRNTE